MNGLRSVASSTKSVVVHVDHLVIGAGVIGLAIGARLANPPSTSSFRNTPIPRNATPTATTVLVVDKNGRVGDETSSRNSEVIHAGLYYPNESWKTRLCIRGKHLLYEYCRQRSIAHRMCGKWIVAAPPIGGRPSDISGSTGGEGKDFQLSYLQALADKAHVLDVPVRWLSTEEMRRKEPHLRATAALESPSSGIVDSHALMQALEGDLLETSQGQGMLALDHRVDAIARQSDGYYETTVTRTKDQRTFRVRSRTVVNSGGLWADQVAGMLCQEGSQATLPSTLLQSFRIYPCRGHYYTYTNNTAHLDQQHEPPGKQPLVSRLVYPIPPDPHLTSLGIHVTIDLTGRLRLGPDTEFVPSKTDYYIDMEGSSKELERRRAFWNAVERYLQIGDWNQEPHRNRMQVDYAGIRPKLSSPSQPGFRDFVLREESENGFPGFVNLVGMESPGLTACLAVAEQVETLLQDHL